jgi:hypothetical protein
LRSWHRRAGPLRIKVRSGFTDLFRRLKPHVQ